MYGLPAVLTPLSDPNLLQQLSSDEDEEPSEVERPARLEKREQPDEFPARKPSKVHKRKSGPNRRLTKTHDQKQKGETKRKKIPEAGP
jgi:hypothetical protein